MYITRKLKRELVLLIDPEKFYPVDYTMMQDLTKIFKKTYLLGRDLTENQIINLRLIGEI